jgi:hypothetical protein
MQMAALSAFDRPAGLLHGDPTVSGFRCVLKPYVEMRRFFSSPWRNLRGVKYTEKMDSDRRQREEWVDNEHACIEHGCG